MLKFQVLSVELRETLFLALESLRILGKEAGVGMVEFILEPTLMATTDSQSKLLLTA
jgi:hypothetical protein